MSGNYWTQDDLRAMSDEELRDFIRFLRDSMWFASEARNARMVGRYSYIMDRLAIPERDRRIRARGGRP